MQAALSEFSSKGYELASTNEIHRTAGVSKGMIFKTFGSKSELYYQVVEIALNHMLKEMKSLDLKAIADPIDRIVTIILWKMQYANQYPNESKLMLEAITSPPQAMLERFHQRLIELQAFSIRVCFEGVSLENISDEYSRDELLEYIEIAVMGIQEKVMRMKPQLNDFGSFREQSIRYLKTLLKGMEK